VDKPKRLWYFNRVEGNLPGDKTTNDMTTIENCEVEAALRNYERAHKTYMATSVFSAEAVRVKEELNRARDQYSLAISAAKGGAQ
jgi:hypothetical protein